MTPLLHKNHKVLGFTSWPSFSSALGAERLCVSAPHLRSGRGLAAFSSSAPGCFFPANGMTSRYYLIVSTDNRYGRNSVVACDITKARKFAVLEPAPTRRKLVRVWTLVAVIQREVERVSHLVGSARLSFKLMLHRSAFSHSGNPSTI